MNAKELEARIRQLLAADRNAFDVYSELAVLALDESSKTLLINIRDDENRHVILLNSLLLLLEKK